MIVDSSEMHRYKKVQTTGTMNSTKMYCSNLIQEIQQISISTPDKTIHQIVNEFQHIPICYLNRVH